MPRAPSSSSLASTYGKRKQTTAAAAAEKECAWSSLFSYLWPSSQKSTSWKRLWRRHRGTIMKLTALAVGLVLVIAAFWNQEGQAQRNGFRTSPFVDWTKLKTSHLQNQRRLSGEDIKYFGDSLAERNDFLRHLDNILIERVPGTVGSQTVRSYIIRQMENLGYHVEVSSHEGQTPLRPVVFHNVIATLNPRAPRRLLLVCHYDSKRTPSRFLGMTDSAVPCSQMINLAKVMREELNENARINDDVTLQLLFLDGEEAFVQWTDTDSIYGARDLAAKWDKKKYVYQNREAKELDRIDLFVLLDLIGTNTTSFMSLQKSSQFAYDRMVQLEKDLKLIKRRLPPQCLNVNRSPRDNVFRDRIGYSTGKGIADDHVPFLKRGVPTLHLISVPFPREWHTLGDDIKALDIERTEHISAVIRMFVAEYLGMSRQGVLFADPNDPCTVQ